MNPFLLLGLAALGIVVLASSSSSSPGALVTSSAIPADASVLLLGDSIGVGIAPHLKPLIGGAFDARVKVGRTTQGAVAALTGDESSFDVVLLSLGSNDALLDPNGYSDAIAQLLAAVSSGTNHVLWIVPPGFTYSTSKNMAGAQAFTDAMAQAGIQPIATSPVAPAPDDPMHLHLSPSGYDAYAHAIATGIYS